MNRHLLKFLANNPKLTKIVANIVVSLKTTTKEELFYFSKENIPFYQKIYNNIDKIEGIPVINKHILPENPKEFLFKGANPDFFNSTSGSSGISTPVYISRAEIKSYGKIMLLSDYFPELINVMLKNNQAINILTYGCTKAGFGMDELLAQNGFIVARIGSPRCSISPVHRIADNIVKLRPSLIAGTPTDFMSAMAVIKQDYPKEVYREVSAKLKILLTTAEPCAKSRSYLIEEEFGITHINNYLSVDGLITIPSKTGNFQLNDKLLDAQVFNNGKLSEFGTGELVFSTLMKSQITKLINFNIGDYVTIKLDETGKKIIIPHGRIELVTKINDRIWGSIDIEEEIFKYELFYNYKFDIYEDKIKLVLETYSQQAQRDIWIEKLHKDLEFVFKTKIEITVVPLGELTDFRALRLEKSILKVEDKRKDAKKHGIKYL